MHASLQVCNVNWTRGHSTPDVLLPVPWHVLGFVEPQILYLLHAKPSSSGRYSVVAPAGREGHSLVWDDETQSAFLFGGQASHRFQYFSDLWRLSFPFTWAQLSAGPPTRSGHSAVWDAASRSMLIFAGRYLSTFYNDLWQYFTATDSWQPLQALHGIPSARIDHTAVWDMAHRAMFIFAGEGSGGPLNDLSRYSLTRSSAGPQGGQFAIFPSWVQEDYI